MRESKAAIYKRVQALETSRLASEVNLSPYLERLQSFAFPKQRAFIEDPRPLKLAQCTRRAAKSYGDGIWLLDGALRWPGSQGLWISLTREEGRRIAWEPILLALVERLGLPVGDSEGQVQFLEGPLTIRFPNRSRIYLVGADANEKEKRKIKGQKFRRVVVDEAQDIINGLRDLVHDVVAPAVAEYRGQIALTGTPGEVAAGYFYELCMGEAEDSAAWSKHFWSWEDNPYVKDEIAAYITDRCEQVPGFRETSVYKRNYKGLWIPDAKHLVYKGFDAARNIVGSLPNLPKSGWHRVLGIDLGFNDLSTFVDLAWHDHCKVCYVTRAKGDSEMDVTAVAEQIQSMDDEVPDGYEALMVDGANKQAVKELQNRHNLPLECADKAGKADFIDIVNSAFERKELMLLKDGTEALQAELTTLTWDKRKYEKLRREENSLQANHHTDGMLYAYRKAYSYLSEAPERPKTKDEEYEDRIQEELEARKAEERLFLTGEWG